MASWIDPVDVLPRLGPQPDAAHRLGQQLEVRDAVLVRAEVGLRVALGVEQGLPLADHAQVAVVDHRHLDRDALDRAGGELLVGHLEAAVAVDAPRRRRPGTADLRAHRRGHRVAHRAQAAGVEPRARLLVADELRRPHLVLAHARRVDRVRAGDRADPLDDVLRGERAVGRPVVAERVGVAPGVELRPPRRRGRRVPCRPARPRPRRCSSTITSLAVAHDRHVGAAVLADLGRVDVGVHDLRARGEASRAGR